MAFTDINSEDRLVQATFADHLGNVLGWGSVYAWNEETFGSDGTLGRQDTKDVVLTRDLRAAITRFNPDLPEKAVNEAIENFILFDASKPGATRKIVARNHQILGVNRAVDSVMRQEQLKLEFPPGERLRHRVIELPLKSRNWPKAAEDRALYIPEGPVDIVERAHPNLGKLGVFWHTQGSGKSYSMAFFAEKVRRIVPGNFTFVLMTDRNDLDSQIYKTFVGCGVADDQTPRAGSGKELEQLLKQNHRYVFSLIHKFNQDVNPQEPYSERDDIVVISDEAHRTQAGKLARNMRVALPNAAFIGFTDTPLFKHDEITKRIFGGYVSRYDFKRSEEDGAMVKLVYENRGEKLGIARLDLNDRIAAKIEERVQALIEAIEATEAHIRGLGFEMKGLIGAQGFARIKGIADAVDAVYTSDESKRRFEILARQVFTRFKALLMEPTAFAYAERHDNIEAVYKKLTERCDTADVTELLKELHRIVNQAIRAQEPGEDQTEGLTFDLSQIDLEKLD